jgi:broad specificity phosphatase PhoE
MNTLFLVRHGQDEDNARHLINGRRDTELTEVGRTQAAEVATQLPSVGVSTIYASPLRRAQQTAEIVAQHLGIQEIRLDPDLIERDYGSLTGVPASAIEQIATRVVVVDRFRYVIEAPAVESYPDLWARAGRVLHRIRNRHPETSILIVAHNEINKMIRANFYNTSWEQEIQLPPLAYCQVLILPF